VTGIGLVEVLLAFVCGAAFGGWIVMLHLEERREKK